MADIAKAIDIFVALLGMTLPTEITTLVAPDPQTGLVLFGAAAALTVGTIIVATVKDALNLAGGGAVLVGICVCLLAAHGLRDMSAESFIVPYVALLFSARFVEGALLGDSCAPWIRAWHCVLLVLLLGVAGYALSFASADAILVAAGLWSVLGAVAAAIALSNTAGASDSPYMSQPFFRGCLVATLLAAQLYVASFEWLQVVHQLLLPAGFLVAFISTLRTPRDSEPRAV